MAVNNFHLPIPEGGRGGNLLTVESDAHGISDGPLTLITTGSGGALTQGQIGGSGPTNSTPYWIKIGTDANTGNDVFMQVWM